MMRKVGLALLCASGLLVNNAFSMSEHALTQGVSVEYELPPYEPQVFTNFFFWSISAYCTVMSELPDNHISVSVLRKSGTVNGTVLTVGQTVQLVLHPADGLNISADSGAKVELINLENIPIKTNCTTG